MSSPASSTILSSDSDSYYSTLPETMTRIQLEGFSFYQHDIILHQQQMIQARDQQLDAVDAFRDQQGDTIEEQQMNLLHLEAELAEAQRALQSHRELVTVCTDNMRYLGQMIEERDQAIQDKDRAIASLSDKVRDLKLQRLQEDLEEEGDDGVEGIVGQPPISPLILPAPTLLTSFSPISSLSSSSLSLSSSSLLLGWRHPAHGLPTTRATATRRRNRPTTFNGPIEPPRAAEQNGRPSHRSRRARHHDGVPLGHESSPSASLSSSSSEETVYPASDASWEPTTEEGTTEEWMESLKRAVERCFLPIPDGF